MTINLKSDNRESNNKTIVTDKNDKNTVPYRGEIFMSNSAVIDLMKSVSDLISDPIFIYKGRFDCFPKDAKSGDVIIKDGSEYIFTDKWEELSSAPNLHKITATTSIYPKLCTQCGAPLHGSICIFCDTEYC